MKALQRYFLSNRIIAVFIFLAVALSSCRKSEENANISSVESFLLKEETGLFGYGGFLFKYTEQECQLSINAKRKEIRLQNDNQTNWLHIQLAKFPSQVQEEIGVEFIYMSGGDEITHSAAMKILKRTERLYWMWDGKQNLGIILPHCW